MKSAFLFLLIAFSVNAFAQIFKSQIPVIALGNIGSFLKNESQINKNVTYYPIDSVFKIDGYSYIADKVRVKTLDERGNIIYFMEDVFKEMVEGGPGNLQNEELILLDLLTKGTKRIEHSVVINKSKLGVMRNYRDAITTFLQNVYKAPGLLEITLAQKIENDIVVRLSADVETYVVLFHSNVIKPYYKIHHYNDFVMKYRTRWENKKIFPLGKPIEIIIKEAKLKSF